MKLLRSLLLCALCPVPLPAQEAAPPAPAAQPAPAAPAYENDPKFKDAFRDARNLAGKHQYSFAVDGYKKANKVADGKCLRCLEAAYDLDMGLHEWKDAINLAVQMESMATTPRQKSLAESDRALAMLRQAGDKPKPAQLAAVHALLQTALADYDRNLPARYQDACVLARMGDDGAASKEFAACAERAAKTDPMRVRAEHFAENPKLSLSKMAPAFEVTALDGTRFNLDNMGGKVVLIDFWATWCGPCNAELPAMRKLAADLAGEPLVILSISWDRDEAKWKDFIAKNGMTWMQYRDADHKLSEHFGVEAIPHYFTIDSDGVLTAEMLGSGNDVEGKLRKLIKRAKDAHAQQTVMTAMAQ